MQKRIGKIMIVIGVLLTLVGLLFKLLKWNDLYMGIVSGPIFIFTGLIIFLLKKLSKNLVR